MVMDVELYGDGDEVSHGWVNATYNSNENIAWRNKHIGCEWYLPIVWDLEHYGGWFDASYSDEDRAWMKDHINGERASRWWMKLVRDHIYI